MNVGSSNVTKGGTRRGDKDVADMTGDLTLLEMVEAAKGGDQSAWDRLVERYMPLVLSVVRRYRLGADDTADVSQTLWLRLVEHLDEILEPRALPGWIVTTTRNEALRLLKTRQRTVLVDPLEGLGLDGNVGNRGEVDEELLRYERHQALRDGLAQLRPHHRELLMLLLADPPLSYDDISARIGIPKGSIGPTRARCLDELRNTSALRTLIPTSHSTSRR